MLKTSIVKQTSLLACAVVLSGLSMAQSSAPGTGRLSMSNHKAAATSSKAANTTITPAVTDKLIGVESPQVMTGVANQIPQTATLTVLSYSPTAYVMGTVVVAASSGTPANDFTITGDTCHDPYIQASPVGAGTHTGPDPSAPKMCTITVTFTPTQVSLEKATITIPLQSIPAGGNDSVLVPLSGVGTASCTTPKSSIMPLIPSHADNETVYCYFNSTGLLSEANQVTYQYNPVGDTNTVGADLLSAVFVPGFQLSLTAIANQNSCVTPAGVTSGTNTTCTQTSSGTGQSPQQAASTLSTGGQFGLRITYPFVDWRNTYFHLQVLGTPRFSANINGIGGQLTPTNSTNFIPFIPAEGYFEWDAIAPPSSTDSRLGLYFDVRSGFEHVPSDYATSVGLSKNNFGLTQISAGLLVLGSFTVSAQRYYGPSQSFAVMGGTPVTANNFGWSFQLQLAPASLAKNAKGGGS
jgi:hypothetical protein